MVSIQYVVEDAPLFGGIKIICHQAENLMKAGFQVAFVGPGDPPDWYPYPLPFQKIPALETHHLPPADITIATFWTTLRAVAGLSTPKIHYCQGFEGSYTHNQKDHPKIREAYRLPLPAMALSKPLLKLVRRQFHRPAVLVPPALQSYFFQEPRQDPSPPYRILLLHPWEIDWKGVRCGLEAIKMMRKKGIKVKVIRISQWPLTDEEKQCLEPDEFYQHLSAEGVAKITRSCDLLFAPSWHQEGFGLPVLESMACGIPVVASRIPAFLSYAQEAVIFAEVEKPETFAEAAIWLLSHPKAWRALRERGIQVAQRFSIPKMMKALEKAFQLAQSYQTTGQKFEGDPAKS